VKKVGDLFAELGFRPDASDGVKRAFIENLVRAAGASERIDARAREAAKANADEQKSLPTPRTATAVDSALANRKGRKSQSASPEQLSFAFDSEDEPTSSETKRRSSETKRGATRL
jgi:hypothetical protein